MADRTGRARRRGAVKSCAALLAACSTTGQMHGAAGLSGSRYVALGSSFAAGPGIAPKDDQAPARCARSANNYAHVLARNLRLQLTDVSCSGATTAHLLGPWAELPPQLDALTGDTALVTVTIGGNDVGYIGRLVSSSCQQLPASSPGTSDRKCPDVPSASEAAWVNLDAALRRIVSEVRRRAPAARLVFVDYLSVLPSEGACEAVPLSGGQADASRATARRLARITSRVAAETGAEVFRASDMSKVHDACGTEPWVTGFRLPVEPGFVPYHPNARGMAAIAEALAKHLR